ncbi:MAG: hypothetical protein ACRDSM_23420, partial [Pseudonocardiaceae bacterium]
MVSPSECGKTDSLQPWGAPRFSDYDPIGLYPKGAIEVALDQDPVFPPLVQVAYPSLGLVWIAAAAHSGRTGAGDR